MLYMILMHIFCFFFANELLLAIYFIYILNYGNHVRQKKQIQVICLLKFKMGHKAAQLARSTIHFSQEVLIYSAVVVQEVLQRRQEP